MVSQTRKKSNAVCQCMPGCKNPPLNNSPFCKDHIKFCPRRSPLTGYEPEFDPDRFNKFKGVKEAHNCFAYAFDHIQMPKKCTKDSCPIPFHQPGRKSGYPKWSKVNGKRCPDVLARLFGDVKGLKMASFEKGCPANTSKIALVTDEDEDYHFYRQDSNGYWSHKPGATDVTHLDATKRPIYDPQLASREYSESGLNYDNFCGYLCAPKGKKLKFKRGGNRNTKKHDTRKQRKQKNQKRNKTKKQ
jgi:hypothetical protein